MSRFLYLALLLSCCGEFASGQDLVIGEPMPEFSLQGTDGKTYTNKSFLGKQPVVIAWFPKAFTGGCTKECQSFQKQSEALGKLDVAYFTASCDSVERNKEFAKSLKLDYVILCDPDKTAAAAFGCLNVTRGVAHRKTYIIGKDGKLLHVDSSVKPATHADQMIAKLKELGISQP